MAHKLMTPEVRFFYDHAGYSYDAKRETRAAGRQRCAESLARAEIAATRRGWITWWDSDDIGEECYDTCERAGTPHHHEILWCGLYATDDDGGRTGRPLASLGSIFDPDRTYARVIAAELADEVLTQERRAIYSTRTRTRRRRRRNIRRMPRSARD